MKKIYNEEDFREAYEEEKRIENAAYLQNTKLLVINVITAIVFAVIFTSDPNSEWFIILSWVFTALAFAATLFCMIIVPQYAAGGTFKLVLMKLALPIVGMLPWYFNCATVWNFGWVKALWMTPLTLILLCAYGAFCALKPSGMSEGDSLTVNDMTQIKSLQKLAGLDPNRIPPTLVDAQTAKQMSSTDWLTFANALRLAGIDVFASKRH